MRAFWPARDRTAFAKVPACGVAERVAREVAVHQVLRLLIEAPTNVPMRNPISLSPQLTVQATSLAACGLSAEIS